MRSAVACALVLVGLVVAGDAAARSARSTYASRLAVLCTDTRKAIEKLPMARTARDLTRTTAQVNEVGRRFVLALAKLRPSAAERVTATQMGRLYATYWGGQLRAYVFLRQGVSQPNASLLNVYTRSQAELSSYQIRAEKLAAALGARECLRQPVRK
jgi:hypothetical protein